ncbi:hypothetical protein MKW94_029000 [Papaver nudicaule]|uniref:FAE domain-containing protein n=1 Tax=Papaver nudicaule TaxID=74823 RepID=A0AA41S0Z0_PAPNU|nr:hypothetical protein [Papaver nudicaule]
MQTSLTDVYELWDHYLKYNLVSVVISGVFIVMGLTIYIMSWNRSVYLVDYACYRPPSRFKFQRKIFKQSGLGEETYLPEPFHDQSIKRHWDSCCELYAGVISVDLAKDLLQVHRNTYAIVVSTENITHGGYAGRNKSMMIGNCLFRVGGAAMLLSNKSKDKRLAKYKLVHVVRTHRGSDDKAYKYQYHHFGSPCPSDKRTTSVFHYSSYQEVVQP